MLVPSRDIKYRGFFNNLIIANMKHPSIESRPLMEIIKDEEGYIIGKTIGSSERRGHNMQYYYVLKNNYSFKLLLL